MTVAEAIKELQKHNGEAELVTVEWPTHDRFHGPVAQYWAVEAIQRVDETKVVIVD